LFHYGRSCNVGVGSHVVLSSCARMSTHGGRVGLREKKVESAMRLGVVEVKKESSERKLYRGARRR
jgi:hypothetical protein